MPYINLKTLGKLTHEQKAKIADEFSTTLEKVAGKPKQYTYVVIEEIEKENWAMGGKLFSDV